MTRGAPVPQLRPVLFAAAAIATRGAPVPQLRPVLFAAAISMAAASTAPAPAPETCPMDLSYVTQYPWDPTSCLPINSNITDCCQTLLSVLGIGFSLRLRSTSHFRLPTAAASAACLISLQSKLSALSLPSSLVHTCFPSPERFVISPKFCARVVTLRDWTSRLGSSTAIDSACAPDLLDLTSCSACLSAIFQISSRLTILDGNNSHATNCLYLTVAYAAGIANRFGPDDPRSAVCILGLSVPTSPSTSSSPNRVIIYAPASFLFISVVIGLCIWRFRRRKRTMPSSRRLSPRPNTGSIWYKIRDLENATGNFSHQNLIGRGSSGVVYRGVLPDGSTVAVKHLLESDFTGEDDFRNEVDIISNLRHRNLVPLRGSCIAGDEHDEENIKKRFLVYDFMPNGSLDRHVFNKGSPPLSWPQRKSIILDVAKALAYLHYGVKPAIYHRDIKTTNILLDGEMLAKVSDFGLAMQSREGRSHLTTRVAGTYGFLAPEYALYGQLTEKSDVYSFGVVVLEIMSGRRALEMSEQSGTALITDWAWRLVKAGKEEEVLDKSLTRGEGEEIMGRFVLVGILCAHFMVELRPTIQAALRMLEGDDDVPEIPDRPLPLGGYGNESDFFHLASQYPLLDIVSRS